MAEIVFFNRLKDADAILKKGKGRVAYVVLDDFVRDNRLRARLENDKRFLRIDLERHIDPGAFAAKYISFISSLNRANHSITWWGLNLANKHPAGSKLPKRVWYLLALESVLKKDPGRLAVFTYDKALVMQFKRWNENGAYQVEDRVREPAGIADRINAVFPVYIISIFFRTLAYKIAAQLANPFRAAGQEGYVVIRTIVNRQSFDAEGRFNDTYFGELFSFIKKRGLPLLGFATVSGPFFTNLKKIARGKTGFSFITIEQAVTPSELLRCFLRSIAAYFLPIRPQGSCEIDGLDFSVILERCIKQERRTHLLYYNLLAYYSTRSLAKKIKISRFIYPFENRGWEKMSVRALKGADGDTRVIGYQHASFSLMLLNFFIGNEESAVIPLPDHLVTMGKVTMEMLGKICRFPKDALSAGCALRQKKDAAAQSPDRRRRKIRKVLVPLALSAEEYVKGIIFLNKAFAGRDEYDVKLRPHAYPFMRIEEALSYVPGLRFRFSIDNDRSLSRSLDDADLVIYFSTTVSLEALMRGIPVVNIGLGSCLNPDPLFEMSDFKWTARTPAELIDIIKGIEGLPDVEYEAMKERGRRYASDYAQPVTDEKMSVFLE